jgi:hypothetical protein
MLERQELWLGPWSADTPLRRVIHEADSREPLGQARWHPRPVSAWRRWLTRASLEVVETEDDSLLLTVRRLWSWAPAWMVHDADDHELGIVTGGTIRDPVGRPLGEAFPEANGRRVLSSEGPELAWIADAEAGCLLTFAPIIAENPFVKMLLLALVLVPDN